MAAIKAIYENGVIRPLQPLNLAEGARVEVSIIVSSGPDPGYVQVSEEEYTAFLGELDKIASLPYSPHPDGRTDISTNHDDILYPKLDK